MSIFDVTTGAELLRVKGALRSEDTFGIHYGRSRWLADSSGVVITTQADTRVVGVDGSVVAVFPAEGTWWQGLAVPSPDDSTRFDRPFGLGLGHCDASDSRKTSDIPCRVLSARVTDSAGEDRASARVVLRLLPGGSWWRVGQAGEVAFNRTSWGLTSDELRIHLVPGGPWEGDRALPLLEPLVDQPPFTRLTALEVDTDEACLPLREAPEDEASSQTCLSARAVVDSAPPPAGTTYVARDWVPVRTEDGTEGWLPVENLRWAE